MRCTTMCMHMYTQVRAHTYIYSHIYIYASYIHMDMYTYIRKQGTSFIHANRVFNEKPATGADFRLHSKYYWIIKSYISWDVLGPQWSLSVPAWSVRGAPQALSGRLGALQGSSPAPLGSLMGRRRDQGGLAGHGASPLAPTRERLLALAPAPWAAAQGELGGSGASPLHGRLHGSTRGALWHWCQPPVTP